MLEQKKRTGAKAAVAKDDDELRARLLELRTQRDVLALECTRLQIELINKANGTAVKPCARANGAILKPYVRHMSENTSDHISNCMSKHMSE